MCMEHTSSPQPCLVLSAQCNEEKAKTTTQEPLVETEECSSISCGSVYGPVYSKSSVLGQHAPLNPSLVVMPPFLGCDHRRIWKPFPLLFLPHLPLLVSHHNLPGACGRMTGKAKSMGVGHQSSLHPEERAQSTCPPTVSSQPSVMKLKDAHDALGAESTPGVHLLHVECHCLDSLPHPSPPKSPSHQRIQE